MVTENINIDVRPGGIPIVIHVTQYEVGLRKFVFTPYTSNGTQTVVAGSATLEGTKPDGYAFQQACQMIDGVITYTLQEQLCAVEGRVWSRLVIRDTDGGMIGYTAIVWVVGRAGVADDAVMSDSDISALRQFLDEFGTIDAYRGALNGALAAVGGPLVAATAAAMTDRTKVYVYTGSESGYTEGHWYYWSGSAWTDGGVYQATGINTDKTLTVEDMAADAKATGDAVAELKNALQDIEEAIDYIPIQINLNKSINIHGSTVLPENIQNEMNWCCLCVSCVAGDVFHVTGTGGSTGRLWGFSNSSGTVLTEAASGATGTKLKIIAPPNATYFAFNSRMNVSYGVYKGEKPIDRFEEISKKINELEPYNNSISKNLYNPNAITNGYQLNVETGGLNVFASHSTTDYIPVTAGDVIYASGVIGSTRQEVASSYVPCICFYDSTKTFVPGSGTVSGHATVPTGAVYARFSCYIMTGIENLMIGTQIAPYEEFKTIADDYKEKISGISESIRNINHEITDITYVDQTDYIGSDLTWTSGYVTKGGSINSPSDSYHYTESISVSAGDILSSTDYFRFVTAYVNGVADASLGAESVSTYTVPHTVTSIVLTLPAISTAVIHTSKAKKEHLAEHVKAIEDKIDGVHFDNSKTVFSATSATLINGQTLTACSNIDNKKNDTIIFYTNVTAANFESVTIGHGYNMAYGASVTVDATKVSITAGTIADYYHTNHGLTIDKFLMVKIHHTDAARADIQVETASGQFGVTANYVSWGGCKGNVFALSTNSSLSNVILSSTFADFEQDIFLFGDSYVGLGDSTRYTTVLVNNGYTDLMIDGYGGRNSAEAMLSFRQILAVAKPKYLIWALGMNDPDTSSAINTSYKGCLDEVIETCETYGVTPILATIPNTPTRLHTHKNAYIKELASQHDYRFIDFAKAVGAEEASSTWWDGMLEASETPANRVHPTELGAQALYARFLIDVPEIADLH